MTFPNLTSPDGVKTRRPATAADEVRLRYDGWYEKAAAEAATQAIVEPPVVATAKSGK